MLKLKFPKLLIDIKMWRGFNLHKHHCLIEKSLVYF